MIARRHDRGGHLSDAHGDGLPLRRHEDHLLVDIDIVSETEQSGYHELGTVAYGVHGRILDDDALEIRQQHLQRHDHPAQVLLVLGRVVHVLRVHDVVHRHEVVRFGHDPRPYAAQFLHVSAGPDEQSEVHAQSANVRPRLAADPEDP